MIVGADASPLRYLVLIEAVDILQALSGSILTSPAILDELSRQQTPEPGRAWIAVCPVWLQTRAPRITLAGFPEAPGAGEREAIALAEELHADALLIDDLAGRRDSVRRQLPTR